MLLDASEFHVLTRDSASTGIEPLDHLLVTSSQQPDWDAVLEIMAPGGTIYALTVDMGEMRVPYLPLVMKALRIQGSLPAARGSQQEMMKL